MKFDFFKRSVSKAWKMCIPCSVHHVKCMLINTISSETIIRSSLGGLNRCTQTIGSATSRSQAKKNSVIFPCENKTSIIH